MTLPTSPRTRTHVIRGNRQAWRIKPWLETLEARDLLSVCTVDRLTDNNVNSGGEGGNGRGDLRWCIIESLYRADTINFSVTGTINLAAQLMTLTRSVNIDGPGPNLVTVRRDAGGYYSVFNVAAGVTVGISGLTVSNGNQNGISNSGTLTINNSFISGNTGYIGGGISNSGMLTINNSTIAGNSAGDIGGGIYNSGTLTVSNSTITGNTGSGAGICNSFAGVLTVSNSTIAGNSAAGGSGGGIYVGQMLTISNSTIAGNSAGVGGGIYNQNGAGHMATRNTIFAGNTANSGRDIYGNMGSRGYNLVGYPLDLSGWTDTDILHENPLLGPLQNNGGPTQTMVLLAGSPALDTGDPTQANTLDQRGVRRTGGVNIGAYQASAATFLVAGFPSPIPAERSASVTVTARDSYGNIALGYRGTFHFTSSDAQATLPANYTFTAADNGVHTFNATLNTPGTQSITATDTGTPALTGTQVGIQVTAAGVSTLQVAGFPSPINAGTAGMVTITARDALGNTVPGYRGTVHFTSSDSQASLPADYTFTATDNGAHTFTVTLKTVGNRSITAIDTAMGSVSGMQAGIQVNPAPGSTLNVAGYPSPVTAGAVQFFMVITQDLYGNTASNYRGTVHFTSSDHLALFSPDYTFTASDNGMHTFGAVFRTAGNQTITATDTANRSITGTESGIVVNPSAADHFLVRTSVSGAMAGSPFDVAVTAQDQFNNTVTGYTGIVHFSSADPYGAILPPNYTFRPSDQGIHTFAGGATLYTAGTWDVTATDTTNGITGSGYIVVTPAPAVTLAITAPASVPSGTPFDVTVTALDPYGNTDTNYTGTVTWTTTDPDPGVVLPPDYTFQPSDQGQVTFPGGVTLITVGDQTITVTDTGSGITGSDTVTVTPGPGPYRGKPDNRVLIGAAPERATASRSPSGSVNPPALGTAFNRSAGVKSENRNSSPGAWVGGGLPAAVLGLNLVDSVDLTVWDEVFARLDRW